MRTCRLLWLASIIVLALYALLSMGCELRKGNILWIKPAYEIKAGVIVEKMSEQIRGPSLVVSEANEPVRMDDGTTTWQPVTSMRWDQGVVRLYVRVMRLDPITRLPMSALLKVAPEVYARARLGDIYGDATGERPEYSIRLINGTRHGDVTLTAAEAAGLREGQYIDFDEL